VATNEFGDRISPYDLVANWQRRQKILARRKALERLLKNEKKDPYTVPRTKVTRNASPN
jgi:hypothetical protein